LKEPMLAMSLLLSCFEPATTAASMAIGKPKAIDDAPAGRGRHRACAMGWPQGRSRAEDGGGRLSCLARNGRSGVPARPVAWGGHPGEETRAVRRCVSGDRGTAVLRPDQAMERPCGQRRTASSGRRRADGECAAQEVWLSRAKKRKPWRPEGQFHDPAIRADSGTAMARVSIGLETHADPSAQTNTLAFQGHADEPHSLRLIPPIDDEDDAASPVPGRPPKETTPDLKRPDDRQVTGATATCATRPCRRQGQRRQSRRPRADLRTARRYGRAQTSRRSLRQRPAM
jgi:hypothetical protein